MQNTNFTDSLQNQKQISYTKSLDSRNYPVSISLGIYGGFLFVLAGLLLFAIYTLSGETNKLENYIGTGFLVIAFTFFGVSAHFLDKFDEKERLNRKLKAEISKQDNQIIHY